LGEVPQHWDVWPLKRIARLQSGETITSDSINETGNFPVFGGNGLRGYTGAYTHDGLHALVGRQGALCGNINYASGKFWASEHALVVTPRNSSSAKWLGELLRAMNLNQYSTSAAQPGLSVEVINTLRIPVPSAPEQEMIAAFLDHEAAKIEELIAEQHRLIELLREKRQVVISDAVTKGMNRAAPLKESGVEWLGMVPKHWAPKRLGRLFRQQKRQGFQDRAVLSVYRDYGVIRKDSRSDNYNKTPEDLTNYQLVEPGDLVVNKMKAWQGSLGISDLEGITSPDYVVFSPTHEEFPGFVHLLLRSQPVVSTYLSISNGIRLAQWRLEPDAFLSLSLFFPPPDEQRAIAHAITKRTAEIDGLVVESNNAIALLQERRTALISAAVTGKIDVRGLAKTGHDKDAAA
jgi:type I restriction enzyme S subunit